jgi:hypothetical protein
MIPIGGAFLKGSNMDFTLTNEDYQKFLKEKEYVSNVRIRPDDMNIFEWLNEAYENMEKTPEGQRIIAAVQAIDN